MKMQYCDVSEHAPLSFSLSFVQEAQERPQTVVICQHLPETGVIFSIFQQLRLNTLLSLIFQQLSAKTYLPFCTELHLVLCRVYAIHCMASGKYQNSAHSTRNCLCGISLVWHFTGIIRRWIVSPPAALHHLDIHVSILLSYSQSDPAKPREITNQTHRHTNT